MQRDGMLLPHDASTSSMKYGAVSNSASPPTLRFNDDAILVRYGTVFDDTNPTLRFRCDTNDTMYGDFGRPGSSLVRGATMDPMMRYDYYDNGVVPKPIIGFSSQNKRFRLMMDRFEEITSGMPLKGGYSPDSDLMEYDLHLNFDLCSFLLILYDMSMKLLFDILTTQILFVFRYFDVSNYVRFLFFTFRRFVRCRHFDVWTRILGGCWNQVGKSFPFYDI